ncbi:MAG: hypothetical protein KAX26_09070 [Anaerolineae bacterium]|nr:hypothetical protein [Anaerolineae bacterium]
MGQRRPRGLRRPDRPSHPCSLRSRRLRRGGLCRGGCAGALPNRRRHSPDDAARLSGGGARSAFWNQIKADVTGLPVQQMAVSDAACLGAAILAAVGTGAFDGLSDAAAAMAHPAAMFEPQAAHTTIYRALFSLWRGLYPALQPTFSRLSQMDREAIS